MKERTAEIRRQLGGVFADDENTYFSCGKDWWSIAYLPKYPEQTAADVMIYGNPSKHIFTLSGNFGALIPTQIKFCNFGDLCNYLNR